MMDLEDIEFQISKSKKLLGSKGTTGTQASFLNYLMEINKKSKN